MPKARIVVVIGGIARVLGAAYGLNVLLFLLANWLIGEENSLLLAFFNTFAHLLWLPTVLLLPVFLLRRDGLVSALLLPGALAFLLTYGAQFVPRSPAVPEDGLPLTVLTYNLLYGNRDDATTLAILRDSDADIIALQELDTHHAPLIEAALSDVYPHMALHPRNGTHGQGLLSRYPIVVDDYWQHDFVPLPLGHQRAELVLPDEQRIVVYNVHPVHPGMSNSFFNPTFRSRELAALLERILAEEAPLLWVGDFNMPEQSADYGAITAHFQDAYRQVGWGMGWTFPAWERTPSPFLRLDYVFLSPHWRVMEARVGSRSGGSDHYPLLVEAVVLPVVPVEVR